MNSSPYLWRPEDHAWTGESHVARFMRSRGIGTLAELRRASVQSPGWFWDEAMRDMGLEWTKPYTQVRDDTRGLPWTRWFIDGQINVTHNCVDRHVNDGHGQDTALFCEAESNPTGEARRVSRKQVPTRIVCVSSGISSFDAGISVHPPRRQHATHPPAADRGRAEED